MRNGSVRKCVKIAYVPTLKKNPGRAPGFIFGCFATFQSPKFLATKIAHVCRAKQRSADSSPVLTNLER